MAYHIQFGIENEFLLTPRDDLQYDSCREFADELANYYENYIAHKKLPWPNMENKVPEDEKIEDTGETENKIEDKKVVGKKKVEGKNNVPEIEKEIYDTSKWTLARDTSIRGAGDGQFGIELISPILHFNEPRFRDFIRGVWARISELCLIDVDQIHNSCGTHVHVSTDTGFHVRQAKAIARAILYFEPAINALVPPDRRKNSYCKTFYLCNKNFQGLDPKQAIDVIDAIIELDDETDGIAAPDTSPEFYDEEFAHPITKIMNNHKRYFTWNFVTIVRTTTIEFRQAPGVTTPGETLAWVEFVVTFVNAALLKANSYAALEDFDINVDGLKKFLKNGTVAGVSDESILDQITGRAGDSAAIPMEFEWVDDFDYSSDEDDKSKGKDKDAKGKESKEKEAKSNEDEEAKGKDSKVDLKKDKE